MRLILSEDQAHRIGKQRRHDRADRSYVVFSYVAKPSNVTAFGIEITRGDSKEFIHFA